MNECKPLLLGMLNRGVLGLKLDAPGLKGHVWLTKCVEWNLDWAIFNGMFDDDFSIRGSFYDVAALRLRMRYLAGGSFRTSTQPTYTHLFLLRSSVLALTSTDLEYPDYPPPLPRA